MKNCFDSIIVIGSGSTAKKCSSYLLDKGIRLVFIESYASVFKCLSSPIKSELVQLRTIDEFSDIDNAVFNLKKGNTLVLSINNKHIFKKCLNQSDITIINFHYGYLPDYKGLNIPSWLIYNKEAFAGVTWHFVNEKIDDGKIIIQDKFRIKDGSTAFDVNKEQNLLGFELFKRFIFKSLENPEQYKNQKESIEKGKMLSRYFAKGVLPDGGYLNLEDTKEHIDRVLRSFDYKCSQLNLPLKVVFDNRIYNVDSYNICHTTNSDRSYLEDGILYLIKEGTQFEIKISICQ